MKSVINRNFFSHVSQLKKLHKKKKFKLKKFGNFCIKKEKNFDFVRKKIFFDFENFLFLFKFFDFVKYRYYLKLVIFLCFFFHKNKKIEIMVQLQKKKTFIFLKISGTRQFFMDKKMETEDKLELLTMFLSVYSFLKFVKIFLFNKILFYYLGNFYFLFIINTIFNLSKKKQKFLFIFNQMTFLKNQFNLLTKNISTSQLLFFSDQTKK
jgi:hypothetical protein